MQRRGFLCLISLTLIGCKGQAPAGRESLVLATTTSVRDSGLLDALMPVFNRQENIEVKVVAVGSGQALELGRRGDADVLVTHAPELEQQFVDEGYADKRRPFMRNEFVIVGPADDPAGIKGQRDGAAAMKTLAERQGRFVSRGDESGTHVMERTLWRRAGVSPSGDWYIEAGTGMAATLRLAHEKVAYTLTDRGTYLTLRGELQLAVLVAGDPALDNVYSVMTINPVKHPHVNSAAAEKFADFLLSPEGQHAIETFGVKEFGEPIFFPLDAESLQTP